MTLGNRLHPSSPLNAPFSLDRQLLGELFQQAKPMGHHEDRKQLNLGFGFLYYSLVRMLRPRHTVVIGSGYGFSVACLALGIKDNGAGRLTFVDPSYSVLRNGPLATIGGADFWRDPAHVRAHFARFGVEEFVSHYRLTSAEFFARYDELDLPPIDLGFIDGNHAYAHVAHDLTATLRHSRKNTYLLLHDTNIYIRELLRHAGVKRLLRRKVSPLKDAFEFVDFPFSSGVALVRVLEPKIWKQIASCSAQSSCC
jgi:hypothetical protein